MVTALQEFSLNRATAKRHLTMGVAIFQSEECAACGSHDNNRLAGALRAERFAALYVTGPRQGIPVIWMNTGFPQVA